MRRTRGLLAFLAAWQFLAGAALGADWPMWRCDPQRTAATAEELPATLHLQWARKLPPPVPAWPKEPRLHFDASLEPVVAGDRLFLGSTDGTLTAYDAATGERRWAFLAGGPVRLAPVAWGRSVAFGSDDGYLYCLDAASGALRWKVRGAPDDRPPRRHLGNARLVSFWPVRGGPVLADGVLYFGAGLWPTLGVFVVAVEAETGRLLWRNAEANFIEKVRVDHNELYDAGLSPQGHLLVAGDLLLVPNGRSMPAVLDRRTGRLLRYVQGYRRGHCRVAAMGKLAFVGRAGVVDISTGREVGSRWAQAGDQAPSRFDAKRFHLFEGPLFPYKMQPGISAWSALTPGVLYGSQRGTFYAYDLKRPRVSEYEKQHAGHKLKPWRWDLPQLWKLATERAASRPPSDALIKAGNRLYGHAGKTLVAVELPAAGGKPRVAWQHPLDGTPASLAAAGGRLFVATKEGGLYCFGGEKAEPRAYALATAPLPKADDAWTRKAADILKATGATEGYALVLGLGTGRLLGELLRQSKLRVIGVDADAGKVRALHARLVAAGLYGTRAEVFVGDPFAFPFPPYLASLIVSETGFPGKEAMRKLFNVLRPYGGALCSAQGGAVLAARRDGALPGSAWWTHGCGDAARSYFSRDKLVKPPLGILWYGHGDDDGFWSRNDYGVGVKPQVVAGRVFAWQLATSRLFAYDAYTGRPLWTAKFEPFTRFATMPDGVYVASGDACTVLDPATGRVRAKFTYTVPDSKGRKPLVSDIRVGEGVAVVAVAFEKVRSIEKGLWNSTALVALDRKTGATLWTRRARHRFNNHALAIGGGSVFVVDSPRPSRAVAPAGGATASELLALDARTGAVRWSAILEYQPRRLGSWLAIRAHDDWLAHCDALGLLLAGKMGQARAFDAATGKKAWEGRVAAQPLIVRGETFVDQAGNIFDTRTGGAEGSVPLSRRGGCNYAVGSANLFFLRDRTVCYVDPRTGARHHLRNARSGCSNSLIAADGILSVPNYAVGCVCNYPIQASFAMVHMPEVARWAGDKPVQLEGRSKR